MNEYRDSYSRDLDLVSLLEEIERGRVGLPDFQRDFDWNEPDVASLLATVLSGWPAGSLLMMMGRPTFFQCRPFVGAPPLSSNLQYVVLDGQQRLTSLYHALKGTGAKLWCLHVHKALSRSVDAELIEDALEAFEVDKFSGPAVQDQISAGALLPLHYASSAADFYDWRDALVSRLPSETGDTVGKNLSKLYRTVLSNAHSYKFPAMMLDGNVEPAAIARIFERINKTGMRLSIFDLLVARSYREDWNLRDVWLDARDEEPLLRQFLGDDGLVIIQAMALSRIGDIRRPALLTLDADTIQSNWQRYHDATVAACTFLARMGCRGASWLPYTTQLIPLAALAAQFDLDKSRQPLEAWLWGSSFTSAYDVASSTVAKEDYDLLTGVLAGTRVPRTYIIPTEALEHAYRRTSGSLWRAFRLFLAWHEARDLITGKSFAGSSDEDLAMEPGCHASSNRVLRAPFINSHLPRCLSTSHLLPK